MAYVGTPIDTTNQFQSLQGKRFNGDGSTTAFTLDVAPSSTLDIEVFVENVRQDPNSAYTLSGTTLTFTGAPASGTNNIYVVHQAKAVGTIDPPATESVAKTFTGNTTFTANVSMLDDDKLILGTGEDLEIYHDGSNSYIVEKGTGDLIIRGESNIKLQDGGGSETLANFKHNDSVELFTNGTKRFQTLSDGIEILGDTGGAGQSKVAANTVYTKVIADDASGFSAIDYSHDLRFKDAGTEKARFDSSGNVLYNKTSTTLTDTGIELRTHDAITVTRGAGAVLDLNRQTNDGDLVIFYQGGNAEGTITISGTTTSYNGFTGTHWSRLADNSKPTILKGTILESLDTMMDWYQAVATVPESTDDNGNVTAEHPIKKSISLNGRSVGDDITFTVDEKEYTGKIEKEGDIKHTKCKVSDTDSSKNVYGLFNSWDEDEDTVNDMYVAQVGTFVIRIHKDETVAKGDLIQSKGDGTGKVQADDIMRSSTVAKVLSTTKIETYSDGSYIVPCSLHC
jgi:hypothetical protein